jgi:hypothetical protein
MRITPKMALEAIYDLQEAHNAALVAHYAGGSPATQDMSLGELHRHFARAATALGFTLTPITEAPNYSPGLSATKELQS